MRNTFKLAGIIAAVALIGFSFAACGGGGGGGDTYTAAIFSISPQDYEAAFTGETAPAQGAFGKLTGEKDDLIAKVDIAMNDGDILEAGEGLSYGDVEGAVQSVLVDNQYITSAQKKELTDELNSTGYVVGFIGMANGEVGVAAAYKE